MSAVPLYDQQVVLSVNTHRSVTRSFHVRVRGADNANKKHFGQESRVQKEVHTMGDVCDKSQLALSWNFWKLFYFASATFVLIKIHPERRGSTLVCLKLFTFRRVHKWRKRGRMYHEETKTLQKPRYGSK